MINMISQGDTTTYEVVSLVADTETDIATIAENYPDAKPGSTCFVIEGSKVYMKNSQGNWVEI